MPAALKQRLLSMCAAAVALAGVSLYGADYLTEGVDNARTGWMRNEKIFNTTNVRDDAAAVEDQGRQHAAADAQPVRAARQGRRADAARREGAGHLRRHLRRAVRLRRHQRRAGVASGSSSSIYPQVTTGTGSTLCPGGQTAVPVIPPTPINGRTGMYAVSWDGRLHTLDLATGQDIVPPEKFAPPNAKPYALNLFNGAIYTSTAQGCGGTTNAFVAYNLATKRSAIFAPAGGGMWGRRGVAIDPEGRVYIGTGDAIFDDASKSLGNAIVSVKMDANGELQLVDYYAPPNANWMFRRDLDVNVTPMAFDYPGTQVPRRHQQGVPDLAARSRQPRRPRSPNGAARRRRCSATTRRRSTRKGVWGAMAAWVDGQGRQWVVVPFYGPVSREFKAAREHARPTNGGVAAYTRRAAQRPLGAGAAVAVARHGHGRARHRRQRRAVRLRQRRGHHPGVARTRVRRSAGRAARRRRQQRRAAPARRPQGGALRPRRADAARSSGTAATRSPPGITTAG